MSPFPVSPRQPRPWGGRETLAYITCEGCNESWAWSGNERMTMTFNEWYQFLDDILLGHLIEYPLCWANQTRIRQ